MLTAPFAHIVRRMVSRVAAPGVRTRRTVLEVSHNTLEPRLAPAALAAPVVDSTINQFVRVGPPSTVLSDYINSQSAVNPTNPLRQVIVAEEVSSGQRTDTYIVARSTIDGGATWVTFARFGGGRQFTADGAIFRDPSVASGADPESHFRYYSNPSATVTPDGQVYVSFLAHNASNASGVLAVRRWDFNSGVTAPQFVNLDPFSRGDGASVTLHSWFVTDAAFNPVIASDPNPASYTDPDSGTSLADPTAGTATTGGQVYVAWSSNFAVPSGYTGQWNGGTVQVQTAQNIPAAQAANAGQFFSGAVRVSGGNAGVSPQNFAGNPQLSFTGNNSVAPIIANGKVVGWQQAPGQLVTAWEVTGDLPGSKVSQVDVTPVSGVTIGGANTTPATITDATPTGGTPANNPQVTTYPVAVSNTSGVSLTGYTLANVSVTLAIQHADVQQLLVELVSPTGLAYTLVQNRQDAAGTAAMVEGGTGITPGLSGANIGFFGPSPTSTQGFGSGATFSDDAPRRISDGANAAPYIGTFYPDVSNTGGATGGPLPAAAGMRARFAGLTPAQAVGNWTIRVTDFVVGPVGPPAPQRRIVSAAVNLNYSPTANGGLRQSAFDTSPNAVTSLAGLTVATPTGVRAVLPLQGAPNLGGAFLPSTSVAPGGIAPGVAIAVDRSLAQNNTTRDAGNPAAFRNPRAPVDGLSSGRLYVAQTGVVDLNNDGVIEPTDDTDVFLSIYDTTQLNAQGAPVLLGTRRLNDDTASDNFSQGLRYQFNPALAVDPRTGTLAASWFDARYDAANTRVVTMLTTSIDGGVTFSPQVPVNQSRLATDVATGRELVVEPLTSALTGASVNGVGTNPLALQFNDGNISVTFSGNPNAPGGYVYTARARTAVGPQVVYSDMGAIGSTVTTDAAGNSAVQPSRVQLDTPVAPTPPRFYQYNATRAGLNGQPSLPGVADGTTLLDGVRVVFDRPIDTGDRTLPLAQRKSSFGPDDVRVYFQGSAGGAPVELRTLYPTLGYRIDSLADQTQGVLADGTGLANLNSGNIVTRDTDFVVRFVDNTNPTVLFPVGLVGTYSYTLSPYIRDRVRNLTSGAVLNADGTVSGNVVVPATKTAAGATIDPVTASYTPATAQQIESRRYQQPGGAVVAAPVYSNDGAGLTNNLTQLVIPAVGNSPGVAFPSNTAFDGVTDFPITFPAGAFPAGQDKIARALVQVDLVHTRRGQGGAYDGLILQLVSPPDAGGNRRVVPLTVQNGGNGVGYDGFAFENTVFDSLAGRPLEDGSGRYQGTFRPVGRFPTVPTGNPAPNDTRAFPTLIDLNGLDPSGTWTLRVIDNFNGDNQYATTVVTDPTTGNKSEVQTNPLGYLRSWSLTVVPGTVTANPFGGTTAEQVNSPRRGNFLDIDGDASAGSPIADNYEAPRSTAPLTLTGGPFQAGGRGLFQIGPFDKGTLPVVVAGPRVLGVSTAAAGGRNLSDQVYVNRPADTLTVKFDRAVNLASINAAALRVTGPGGLVGGPFSVSAGAAADEVVIGFLGTRNADGSTNPRGFTRGGSYTVQFDSNVASSVGDKADVNLNAGVDRLFGGNAATAAIQTGTFGNAAGNYVIRSAPVQASAGGQTVTGETVTEIPIPVTQSFQLAQDLQRFPESRLKLALAIRDFDTAATPALFSGLTADLVAPDGTRIRLFTSSLNSQSGPGSTTTQILFDDGALSPAGGGINPFQTSPYNPQQPLARLLGKWSFGTWKVVVTNTQFRIDPTTLQARDLGQILSASLTLARAADSTGLGEARADETTLGFRVFNQDPTSKESGQVWQAVGASPSNNQANVGRVSAVTVDTSDPTGNTVFAAGASGGVWRTSNFLTTDPDGPSWVPLTDFGPGNSLNIASIALFPRNNDPAQTVVFALTGEGNSNNLPNGNTAWTSKGVGVLRSFNGGQTWDLLDSDINAAADGSLLPVNSPTRDRKFVGASGFKIIVDPVPYQTLAGDINRTPPNNLAVYMAVSDSRPTGDANFAGGIWRSLDSGRSWTRIGWGNATDVTFAPGAIGPDGNTQTLYGALLTAPGVTGGVYITRQATNVPAAAPNSTGALQYLLGGASASTNVVRDQLQGQDAAVTVGLQFGPFVSPTRITLAVPALTSNPLTNALYQSWLYAATSNADGSFGALFVTKDFGGNWTQVDLPEMVDAAGNFWSHNDESQLNGKVNAVEFNPTSQFTSNVGYTRNPNSLSDTSRTYVPRPGGTTAYGTTPRAAGQGQPGGDGSGGTGNRALSLAVDPLNPAVVFLGGDRSLRVDTGVIKDAQSFYYFDNTNSFPATLLGSRNNGGVTLRTDPQNKGLPLEGSIPTGPGTAPWGVIIPGQASPVDTANGLAPVYRDKYGLPAGFVNLSRDPSNPFLNPSVIGVYNATNFTNTGENAKLRPFDSILFGSYDVTTIVPFVDPQTGKTRLIYGTANGIYTGVDTAAPSGASLDVAIGDSRFVGNPTQVAGVVTGSRNGNLQIGQYYQGAVQPSRLSADIAGALFYAVSQDNGYPVSSPGVVETGNPAMRTTDWPGTGLNVVTDQTGGGSAFQYRLPSSSGTDTTNTFFGNPNDFVRILQPGSDHGASGIGRVGTGGNSLLAGQNPTNNQGNFPLNDTRYGTLVINPITAGGLAISAAPFGASSGGNSTVFRSEDGGSNWQSLGAPAGFTQYVSALAFGGPDTRFPTQKNNFILAGTGDSTAAGYSTGGSNGQVYFTVNGTQNSWVRVPGDSATGGRSVLKIVADPRFSSAQAFRTNPSAARTDFYVITDRQVFYVNLTNGGELVNGQPVPLDRDNPNGVAATWTDVTGNLYFDTADAGRVTRTLDSFTAASVDSKTGVPTYQTVDALSVPTPGGGKRQLDLTSLAVDWRYTNPVLYVAGDGGVFRSVSFNPLDPAASKRVWTLFPDNPTGSYTDGGYLPNVRITDLDLSLGVIETTYDPANPNRGGMPALGTSNAPNGDPLPRDQGGLNLLVATTYGRGQFVTRINPADPALSAPVDPIRPDAFVSGPRVSTIANPNAVGGPSTALTVVFSSPVDPVTFRDTDDVTLLDPTGAAVTGVAITQVPGVPGQPDPRNRYTLSFPAQTAPGFYFLRIGDSKNLTISDLAGNRMNQNGNLVNGETFSSPNGDDTFTTFVYLNGLANSLFVTGLPSKISTWAPTPITVTATRKDGSVDPTFAGTVKFTSTDPNQSVPANYTFTPLDGGRKQFTLTFRTGAAITNPDGTLVAPVTDLTGLFQSVTVDLVADPSLSYNAGKVGADVFNARVEVAPARLPAATSAWDPKAVTANVVDYNGNRLPAFDGVLALSSTDPNALLPAPIDYTPGVNNGTATFTDIIFRTQGSKTLTYKGRELAPGQPTDGIDPLTVTTAVSNAVLDVTGFATDGTGKLITSTWDPQALTVTVRSQVPGDNNKVLTSFNTTVSPQAQVAVTTDDPLADVTPAVISYPAAAGTKLGSGAGATELLFRTKGSPTRQATFSAGPGVDTTTLNPTVVNAQFRVTGLGSPQVTAWNPQALTVAAISPVTSKVLPRFAGDVSVTSSDALALAVRPDSDPLNKQAPVGPATSQKYTYAAADGGSRVQTLILRGGSKYDGTINSGTPQSFAFSSPVGIDPLTVGTKVVNAVFSVQTLPPGVTAGKSNDLKVSVADPLNNLAALPAFTGEVTFGSSDPVAVLTPSVFTYTAGNLGSRQVLATYKTAGTQTFTAQTTNPNPNGVDPLSISTLVSAADASLLTLSGFNSPVVAGTADDYTVTAFDRFGNVATAFRGTVNLTSTDPQAAGLPFQYTFTPGDAGSHTFIAELRTAGKRDVVATEVAGFGLSASQTGIVVLPAQASQFTLFGYPTSTVAGVGNPLLLKASDRFGNTATDFVGTVTFTSSDPLTLPGNKLGLPSGLPADYTFSAADKGQKQFSNVELRTAGVQSISAASGAISSTQGGITVVAADASTFDFSIVAPLPPTLPAGGQVSFLLVARDRFGNQDKLYDGTTSFTSTDKQAGLPAPYTFSPNDGGQKGFTATLLSSGPQTLTATDRVTGAAGTSPVVTVTASAAGLLNVAGFPQSLTAGDTGGFSVTLFDNRGNVSTGFTGTVRFSSSDPTARFALESDPATALTEYTFSAADAGTRRFVATLTQSGSRTITVTPTTDPQVNSGTVSTQVNAAAAVGFRVSDYRSPTDAGQPGLVRVTALDRFNNTADGYGGLVRVTSSDPQATLPPQGKLTNGVGFFLVTLATPGTQSISASDSLDSGVLGSQQGIAVVGAPLPPTARQPVLSPLPATSVTTGGSATVGFTVTTFPLGTDAAGLVYTATSTDPQLVPSSGLVFGGAGGVRSLTITPAAGRTGTATITVTATDPATNLFTTTQLPLAVNPVPLPPEPPAGSRTNYFAVGADIGVSNRVDVYNPDGTLLNRLEPFAAGFTFGTRVATVRQASGGQLIAAVPGPGRQTEVKLLDPVSGSTVATLAGFESSFEGGLFVAAGDVNGDGYEDIAISPDQGGGGRVKVYDGKTFAQLADFFGIDDPSFRGGARVAFGDLNGDGKADLIVSAGFGGGPRVALFDGTTVRPDQAPVKFMGDFFVFEQTLRNGVFLTAGDLTGDGKAELVVAGGPGGGPRVFALDGAGLMAGQFNPVANFFAGNPDNRGGVRVAVKNLDGDRFGDLVTGDGVGSGTTVRTYFGADIVKGGANSTPLAGLEFEELPGATNGVFVG